jgi:hypothetical protein
MLSYIIQTVSALVDLAVALFLYFDILPRIRMLSRPDAPLPKNQPGESAGVTGQDLPEVRIQDHAGSGQAD